MKLSYKFFCIAYVIVLLSTGIVGFFLVNTTQSDLWNAREEQFLTANKYACDSFVSLTDVYSDEISSYRLSGMEKQIINSLDNLVTEINIIPKNTSSPQYFLSPNQCLRHYIKKNGLLLMQTVCCLDIGSQQYYLVLSADFTALQAQSNAIWKWYGIYVFSLSAVSGVLLFIFARRIASPINRMSKAAKSIASGNYGETVTIKSTDYEIKNLSQSFNTMSQIVKRTIAEIQTESEKRDMFVADFTHEIKTPMTAIIGYAEMLNSYTLTQQEIKRASKAIYKEGKRLERLSLQLLDLYVYRNDNVELEPIELSSLTKELETTLIFLSRKYCVGFTVDFSRVLVMANPVLLISLLYNLADNAFKASNPNDRISISCTDTGDSVSISVTDNGRGISPENIKLLTEPFFREDKSRSRKLGGAGLGLALCKEIAQIHGTSLNFQSRQGKGTTVWFNLQKGEIENE